MEQDKLLKELLSGGISEFDKLVEQVRKSWIEKSKKIKLKYLMKNFTRK